MARTIIKTGFGSGARTTLPGGVNAGSYDLVGIGEISKAISLIKQSINLRELYGQLQHVILNSIKERFEDGNASDPTNQWDKLHSETIRVKKEGGYSNPEQILVMSGAMRESIIVDKLTSSDLKIVCTDPKGPIHEGGGMSIPNEDGESFNVPARPFMYLEPNIVAEIWSTLLDFVDAGMSGMIEKALPNYQSERASLPKKLTMNKQNKIDLEVRINNKPVEYDGYGDAEYANF